MLLAFNRQVHCLSVHLHKPLFLPPIYLSDMTVEEWIVWMEEKKRQGMTTEQQIEYEKRKKVWSEREKEREEQRRGEEEEKMRKTRERMARDYQSVF